jgi:heme/copper-type cytochrome/quinol oxidase subunit 3
VFGAVLVLAASVMLFAALIGTFIAVRGVTAPYPPKGVRPDRYIGTMMAITAFLIAMTAQWGVYSAQLDDRLNSLVSEGLTALLALAQVGLGWWALRQAHFGPGTHAYGTMYFVVIGAYTAYAAIGLALALFSLGFATSGQISPRRYGMAAVTAMFWWFMTATAAALFYTVWVLR